MGICSSKMKSGSSVRVNQKGRKVSSATKYLLSKVSKEEAVLLQLLFNDLVRKSTGESITKDTFLSIYQFPGLLGERLFHYFDTKKNGLLDFECFLNGMVSYCKGNLEKKQRTIFEICDFKEDLVLDSKELFVVRVLLGPDIFKKNENNNLTPVSPIRSNPHSARRRSKTVVKPVVQPSEELTLKQEVQNVISSFGDGEVLTFTDFQKLLKNFSLLFRFFEEAFNEKFWSCENLEETSSPSPRRTFTNSQVSGELFVKTGDKLVMRFAILRDKVLLLYESLNAKHPEQLIMMEGCYAEIIGDYYVSNKFGIQITHSNSNFGEIMLWSDSRKERDDWLKYLEIASGNKKFKEFFSIGEKIGQGKFSDVYICTEHVSYKKWAVKVINKSKLSALEKELLSSEIKILKIVSHPNIVKIKEIFDSKKHILIVMELIEGGELFELIQKRKVFSEYATSKIIKQLLDAVIYLHELGILHRDIKPENILLADNSDIPNIKLADFGLSKLAGPNEVQLLACGTLGYVAPEVLSQGGYSFKADLWSVGIITYLLLRGRLPFDHKDKKVLIDLTLKACLNFDEPYWKAFTPFALSFLNQAIHKRPEERLGPLAALEHSWIKNSEILIPRAIDKKKMEEMFIEKGVSSTNFGKVQYREIALDVNANPAVTFEVRSMPDLYEEAPADGAGETIMVNSIID